MARLYATTAQAWPTDAPADADLLLRTASRLVDVLLVTRRYAVDTAGMPTDPDNLQALQDATVAIAHELQSTGAVDPGSTQQWESVAIGSVQLSTLQGASASDALTVAGLPVPGVALVLLADVGTHSVLS